MPSNVLAPKRNIGKKVEERLCNTCRVVEDEIHLLCECNKYNALRNDQIIYEDGDFRSRTNEENFIYIMTTKENYVLKAVGKF